MNVLPVLQESIAVEEKLPLKTVQLDSTALPRLFTQLDVLMDITEQHKI